MLPTDWQNTSKSKIYCSIPSPIRPSIIMSFHAVIIFGGIFYEPVKCIFKPHEDKELGALMQHYLSCHVYPSVCFSLCKSCHICGMQIHLHVYWQHFKHTKNKETVCNIYRMRIMYRNKYSTGIAKLSCVSWIMNMYYSARISIIVYIVRGHWIVHVLIKTYMFF